MAEFSSNVEQEIAELEKALAKKKAVLEQQKTTGEIGEVPHPKEILREVIREKIAATPGAATLPPTTTTPPPPSLPPPSVVPPSYLTDELKPKVQELVNVAFEKSLEHAISLAKAADNAALLDAFHDIMVDELYTHLVERGKLQVVT